MTEAEPKYCASRRRHQWPVQHQLKARPYFNQYVFKSIFIFWHFETMFRNFVLFGAAVIGNNGTPFCFIRCFCNWKQWYANFVLFCAAVIENSGTPFCSVRCCCYLKQWYAILFCSVLLYLKTVVRHFVLFGAAVIWNSGTPFLFCSVLL